MADARAPPASTERLNPREVALVLMPFAPKSSAVKCTLKLPFRSWGFVRWPITTMDAFIGCGDVSARVYADQVERVADAFLRGKIEPWIGDNALTQQGWNARDEVVERHRSEFFLRLLRALGQRL
jgi:hypothetical protein